MGIWPVVSVLMYELNSGGLVLGQNTLQRGGYLTGEGQGAPECTTSDYT